MRITRTNYAIGMLFITILSTILGNLVSSIDIEEPIILLIILLSLFGGSLFLTIGRLRDMNVNPWWSILAILPYLNLILLFPKGTEGINKYGNDPREKK